MLLDWGRGQELASPYSAPKSRGGSFERRKRQGLEPEMWVAGCLWHPLSVALSRSLGRLQRQTNKIEKQLEWADQERSTEGWISSLWMAGGLLICSTNQSWPTPDTNICPSPHFSSLAAQLWTLGRCNCWIWQKKVFHLVKMSMTKHRKNCECCPVSQLIVR